MTFLYASPLSSTPVDHSLPTDYYTAYRHGSWGFHLDGYGLVADGYGCEAEAIFAAQDHAAQAAEEAESAAADEAYEEELTKLYDLVNAQGGVPTPGDAREAARVRAVGHVLDAIDALGKRVVH